MPGRPSVDSRSTARRRGRVEAALWRRWIRLRHRGDAVECPCCGRRWAAFAADWNRPSAVCPGCGAHERHRALWLYMRDRLQVGHERIEMLHFAPEHAISRNLSALERVERVTADLDGTGVDVAEDIERLSFADESFDAILCSHVLEHVADDRAAMAELRRALRPGGWALVMVPLDGGAARTYEDETITSPAERERAFWQHDHVRLYAPDIADRLRAAGLEVEAVRIAGSLPADAVTRHGLLPDETVFHCVRPPG